MKKPRTTPIPCPPKWVTSIVYFPDEQRAIFHYELARRTPTGRAKNWPQWNEVKPEIMLSLLLVLWKNKTLKPVAFKPTAGFHTISYFHPSGSGSPVYFNLELPIEEIKDIVEKFVRYLRVQLKIKEHPKASPQTQAVAWNWLQILDSKKQLNAPQRSIKTRALVKGQSFVEAVERCFEDPAPGQEIGPLLVTWSIT